MNAKKLLPFILAVMAIVTLSIFLSWRMAPTPPTVHSGLPDCVTEDDPRDCYWDANRRGNQPGSSFIHWHNNYYLLDT